MSLSKALTAAAGNAGAAGGALYVEDVFSTYLYEGNGSTQTITNGIDLDGEGGLVWIKERGATANHYLFDTERGSSFNLRSNLTNAQQSTTWFTGFNSNGFGVQSSILNGSSDTLASWTFRKAEKFFDVVTYTGNGGVQNISHNLGAVPAVIIVKNTQSSYDWGVYTASTGNGSLLLLNSTSAAASPANQWNNTTPTDTVFTVGNTNTSNRSGQTYVAYLFASDAGGFGDDGSESIIKCGNYTGNGSTGGPEIDLGFEPQWLMVKNSTASSDWYLVDTMRGFTANTSDSYQRLRANLSDAEDGSNAFSINSTGFKLVNATFNPNVSGNSYIYIAIRRPMKTPESGTEVFATAAQAGGGTITTGFPTDLVIEQNRGGSGSTSVFDRLRSVSTTVYRQLNIASTAAENVGTGYGVGLQSNTQVIDNWFGSGSNIAYWMFKRATGFFDVVAYTGTGSATTQAHNLAVVPEMIIVKRRSSTEDWLVYHSATGNQAGTGLNETNATYTGVSQYWNSTSPTDTVFSLGTHGRTNTSAETYIAYLFATLAGVSKVGSFTGIGSGTLNVDCGFSTGCRFVLIKRTDGTGDWWVFDSARGITVGNDPRLALNSTSAETSTGDFLYNYSSGFVIEEGSTIVNGANYIFLAIA